jgi:hypothetical protein
MTRSLKLRLAMIPAAVAAGVSPVYAAVPTEVTTALSTIQADALTVAGVVLVAIIAVFAFKFLRKGI